MPFDDAGLYSNGLHSHFLSLNALHQERQPPPHQPPLCSGAAFVSSVLNRLKWTRPSHTGSLITPYPLTAFFQCALPSPKLTLPVSGLPVWLHRGALVLTKCVIRVFFFCCHARGESPDASKYLKDNAKLLPMSKEYQVQKKRKKIKKLQKEMLMCL